MDIFQNKAIIPGLVSVIVPAYNCENFITKTIESIIYQTYKHLEIIVVDDYSTDKTSNIIKDFQKRDQRIKYHKLGKNSGAAVARNVAIKMAVGEYISFIDSDDLWKENKLEKQISFMRNNNYHFTSTNFEMIDSFGNDLNKIVRCKKKLDYNGILKQCPGNSTVIYNAQKLGKFYTKDIRKRNDYLMWLQVIKKAEYLYGLDETLTKYTVRKGSLSKNKFSLVSYHWHIYRDLEKLSVVKSIYLIFYLFFKILFRL